MELQVVRGHIRHREQHHTFQEVEHRGWQSVGLYALPLFHVVTLSAFYPIVLMVSHEVSISFHRKGASASWWDYIFSPTMRCGWLTFGKPSPLITLRVV